MSKQESAPGPNPQPKVETRPTIVNLPFYIDPSVLVPGQIVRDTLDPGRGPLTVLRVEPELICQAADGTVVSVYAHLAVLDES